MKKVTISVIDRSKYEPQIVYVELMAKIGMNDNDVLEAIEQSCQEYYYSDKEKAYVGDYSTFGYDDFQKYVPNDICEKHGISKILEEKQIVLTNELLLDQNDMVQGLEWEEDYW